MKIRPLLLSCVLVTLVACDSTSDSSYIASAQALLAKRDTAGAVIQLKNALLKNPDSTSARLLLGKVLLQGGDPKAALVQLQKARQAQVPDDQVVPDIARALLAEDEGDKLIALFAGLTLRDAAALADLKSSLAAAYAAQGQPGLARATAAAALQARPGHAPAIVVLARLDAAQGDLAGGLRQLEGVLARDAGDAGAGLLKGEILLLDMNDADGAMDAVRTVLAANPDAIAARTAVINALLLQHRVAEARYELEQLKKAAPENPETLFLQAQFAFDDQDYAASREINEILLAAMPNNLRVLMLASAVEFRRQQFTLAEGLLSRATKRATQRQIPLHMLAQHYLRADLPDKAIEVLQPLVDAAQPNLASLTLSAEAQRQAGDTVSAEAVLQRALKVAPADERTRTALAVLQLARNPAGPALAELEAIAKDGLSTQADLALVNARLQANDGPGALRAIAGLERKLPGQALPNMLRGRVLARQGDALGAAASFEQALGAVRDRFPVLAELAGIDIDSGQPERARQRFKDLLQTDPKHYRAKVALAEIDARLGAPAAVVTAQLQDAVRMDPAQPGPQLRLIEQLLASGNSAGALRAAQAATLVLPKDLGVMDALGQAQLAAGDSANATATFQALSARQPANPLPKVRLAAALLATQDLPAAERALRQAVGMRPDDAMAQRGLALLMVLDKRPGEASAIARAMQRRQPQNASGYALEGEIEARVQHWAAAEPAYRAALLRSPSTDMAVQLHRCLVAGGKAPDAERLAATWRRDQPRDAAFSYHLGTMASAAKDWPRAEALYREVIALQPRHAQAMNNVAWLMATQRKAGATAMAEQALALQPDSAPMLDTLAWAQAAENQLSQAVRTQKRATKLDAQNPQFRLRLAQLLVQQGDRAAARNELEALAKLGPAYPGQAEVAALLKGL